MTPKLSLAFLVSLAAAVSPGAASFAPSLNADAATDLDLESSIPEHSLFARSAASSQSTCSSVHYSATNQWPEFRRFDLHLPWWDIACRSGDVLDAVRVACIEEKLVLPENAGHIFGSNYNQVRSYPGHCTVSFGLFKKGQGQKVDWSKARVCVFRGLGCIAEQFQLSLPAKCTESVSGQW